MVCEYGTEVIVLDTASQLNAEICAFWDEDQNRPVDDFKYWRKVRNTEAAFFPRLLRLPCDLVILSHEKPVLDGVDSAKKRLKALTPSGDVEFTLAISGGALGDYYDNLDLAVTLLAKKKPGGKEFVRELHPYGVDGRSGKCRLQHLLDLKEKPHLGELRDKVRARA